MRPVKLAVILPVAFCSVEGLLWYWNLHSKADIPDIFGWNNTAANFIGNGLNAPAHLFASLISMIPLVIGDSLPDWLLRLNDLLWVACIWHLIGNWLDHCGDVDDPPEHTGVLSPLIIQASILAFGVLSLFYSFSRADGLHISNFIQTIYIALLQTWAVFLIGIPTVGIARLFLKQVRKRWSSDFPPRPYRPISNFRLLEVIVGVFAALVLLWLPPGPLLPK